MCCEAFWKRVVVFCLTFGLGVFVSNLFISKESAKENPKLLVISSPSENNCVPVDDSLRYERLTAEEKPNVEAKKQEDNKKSLKAEKEKQNNPAESKPQFYNPSKDSAGYKDLLHREKCYESDGRK